MAKLSLTANPTFKAKVGIPVPGAKPVEVEFTFKHKNRDQIKAWSAAAEDSDRTNGDGILDIALGWELDDEFTVENANRLCNEYMGAAAAIFSTYLDELRGSRAKN